MCDYCHSIKRGRWDKGPGQEKTPSTWVTGRNCPVINGILGSGAQKRGVRRSYSEEGCGQEALRRTERRQEKGSHGTGRDGSVKRRA